MHAGEGVGPDHPSPSRYLGGEVNILLPAIERQVFIEPDVAHGGDTKRHVAAIGRAKFAFDPGFMRPISASDTTSMAVSKAMPPFPMPFRQHQAGRADDIGMVAEQYDRPS